LFNLAYNVGANDEVIKLPEVAGTFSPTADKDQ